MMGGRLIEGAGGLHARARALGVGLSGFYHDNIRVDTGDGPVVVRVPIGGADRMDLRVWPEHEVLASVAAWVDSVPALLHVCDEPPFQVHRFIEGELLDEIAPPGVAVPEHLPKAVARLFGQLSRVPAEAVPKLPDDWPASGRCGDFARRLSDATQAIWDEFSAPFQATYAALRFPDDPLAAVRDGWDRLSSRPFALLHCDVHRKNVILDGTRAWFLDWELALWGDPVYEVVAHLHKMAYQEHEAAALRLAWAEVMPEAMTADALGDIEIYLRHEHVKSAIVDTVRFARQVRAGVSAASAEALAQSLTDKLRPAEDVWESPHRSEPGEVLAALLSL